MTIEIRKNLAFWFPGAEVLKLADAAKATWERWEAWLNEAVAQADIANASLAALELHAVDRSIDRLPGETEAIWRDRVKSAFTSASEAGSRKGLEQILAAHGVLNFSVEERVPGLDWDIVLVNIDPDSLSIDSAVLLLIFARWGRPTRRFSMGHTLISTAFVGPGNAGFIEDVGIAT